MKKIGTYAFLAICLVISSFLCACPAAGDDYGRGLRKVQSAIKGKDFATAEALLEKMRAQFPANPELLAIQARLYFWEGKYEKSIDTYRKIIRGTPSPALRKELAQVLLEKELRDIDGLRSSGEIREAEKRLVKLLRSGMGGYDVACRFRALYNESGRFGEAVATFDEMRERFPGEPRIEILFIEALLFRGAKQGSDKDKRKDLAAAETLLDKRLQLDPDDSELLSLKGRLCFWEKRYPESLRFYRRLIRLQPTEENAKQMNSVRVAAEMEEIDNLLQAGDVIGAEGRLESMYRTGSAHYDSGLRLASLYLSKKNYPAALRILGELHRLYPNDPGIEARYIEALYFDGKVEDAMAAAQVAHLRNPSNSELLAVRARICYWTKQYDEAVDAYRMFLQLKPDGEMEKELKQVSLTRDLAVIDELTRAGDKEGVLKRLLHLYQSGNASHEAGCRLGILYLHEKRYEEALQLFTELHRSYPDDNGIEVFRIEAMILTDRIGQAQDELEGFTEAKRTDLATEHEDLFYRVRRNYLKISGEHEHFTKGNKDGNEFMVEVARRVGMATLAPRYSHVSRFGLNNSRIGLDVSTKVGESGGRWGYLAFSFSPDASFLPEWTAGGALYQGYRNFEFFAGYTRMSFSNSGVDIFSPGVIASLPAAVSLEGKLYLVPSRGSVTGSLRVLWEPGHKIKSFYNLAIGQSAETIVEERDVEKIMTYSQRFGVEYRFRSDLSVGAELSHSVRERLYNTTGMTLYSRFWW